MSKKNKQKDNRMKRRFTALFSTNFWGVLNDNFLKTLASFIAMQWVSQEYQGILISAAAGALVLPYIFFSPLAGRLTQIKSKKRIIRIAKWAEIIIMILAIMGFYLQSITLVLSAITLMGLQSALYSPAKYSLIRDVGGAEKLSVGVGGMEAVSFAAMILGIVIASFVAGHTTGSTHYVLLITFAVVGLASSYAIKAKEEYDTDYLPINPVSYLRIMHQQAKTYKGLNAIIYALSWFWWLAGSIQIGLIVYCQQILALDTFRTGLIMAAAGAGMVAGSICTGLIDKRHPLFGYVAFFGWTITLLTLVLFTVQMSALAFSITLFAVAFCAGMFKTPLDIEIQKRIKGPMLNQFLAYFNQISFVFILLASLTFALLSHFASVSYLFLMISVVFFVVPMALLLNCRPMICYTVRQLLHLRYRIRIQGIELMNTNKAHLILPNHAAVMDPIILFAEMYNYSLQPLVDEGYFKISLFRKILGLFDAICVPDLGKGRNNVAQAGALLQTAIQGLEQGGNVLFYPSGHVTHNGNETIGNRQLAHKVCKDLPPGTQVLMIRTKGLWGSTWSRYGRKSTPNIGLVLLRNAAWCMCGGLLWIKRRNIDILIEDMTTQVMEWSQLERREFNNKLAEWYNE